MTETLREQLAERLSVGVIRPLGWVDAADPIAELEQRRRQLAPEALAGDAAAMAELEQIETAIAGERRLQELLELAKAEQAARARIAAAEEAEQRRTELRTQLAVLEGDRAKQLEEVEESIGRLVDGVAALRATELEIAATRQALDPEFRSSSRPMGMVEDRLTRRLRDVGMRLDGRLFGRAGMEPLGRADDAHTTEAASEHGSEGGSQSPEPVPAPRRRRPQTAGA